MLTVAIGFVVGLLIGSFSKATADRTIKKESILGRSYCPKCKHGLSWYDLFPVLSFVMLQGRCRYCHKKISLDNLIIEIASGAVVALLFFVSLPSLVSFTALNLQAGVILLDLIFKIFVISILFILFWVDFKIGLIPDRISIPAIIIAVFYLIISSGLKSWWFYQSFTASPLAKYLMPPHSPYLYQHLERIWLPAGEAVLVAGLSALAFSLLIILTKGRGMGWGDVKYVFFLGLALGFSNTILAIFGAFLSGAIFSIIIIALGKKHFGETIPFGPFLSLGAAVALLFGPQIINWYLRIF